MGKFLKRNINTVFVMLGNSCNMNCAYCLQHPLVHNQLAKKINPEIYEFLAEIAEENKNGQLHLQFFGGEPLIYFRNIKEVVLETKKRKISCTYSAISNGRAITDEMVEFFNNNDIPLTVSWDGDNTLSTRGFDVFADSSIKGKLLKIKHLGLSGVISAKAYPKELLDAFQRISDEYFDIHGYPVRVNLDEIFDTGIANKWLLDVDYNRVEEEMREITENYLESFDRSNQDLSTKTSYLSSFLDRLYRFYNINGGVWNQYTVSCGNGLSVLNLDLDGNLYSCHNTSEKAGNIHSGYFNYLQKIIAGDHTKCHREKCAECPAMPLCKGGCKLVSDKAREETYCKLKRAVFSPVIAAFKERAEQIEKEQKTNANN